MAGSLCPCIDYWDNVVKYRHLLPVVPVALEQVRGAQIFTKQDLQSAYKLIHIREGDEWKLTFINILGHNEDLVIPYGLFNAPSVFQAF